VRGSTTLRTLIFGFTTTAAGSVRACDRVDAFLISTYGSIVV